MKYTYDTDGNITNIVYGNGGGWNYTYDGNGNITSIKTLADTSDRYVFEYDENDLLVRMVDNSNNTAIIYNEDGGMTIIDNATSETLFSVSYDEDDTVITVGNNTFTTSQTYDEDLETTVTSFAYGSYTVKGYSVTDNFGRLGTSYIKRVSSTGSVTTLSEKQYTYVTNQDGATSERVSGIRYVTPYGSLSASFTYDANGNIATVYRGSTLYYSYEYDSLNQLIREDDRVGNKTVIYTYDDNGNIQSKKIYALSIGTATADLGTPIDTVNFGYSSSTRDVITSYDGQSITTDNRGNITSWDGMSFVWQGGNQLTSITDGINTYTYTYNSDGLRTSKTVNGVTTDYYWVDNVLTAQVCGDNIMLFRYDSDGNPMSFNYNGTEYFYVLNTQGDVSALMDASGMTIAFYYYDAWGNISSIQDYSGNVITSATHIANINPIRYRGYYYDTEIEMYYLQSRYYSPELCRFISSDEIEYLGASGTVLGYNLFAYCENNPVTYNDASGTWLARVISAVATGAVFATLAHVILKVVNAILKSVGHSPLSKKVTTLITVGVGALGAVVGAVLGPSFLAKHTPNLLKAINQIEKTKFSIKGIKPNSHGNIFGINISNTLMIMLHYPHAGKNEWNFHVQVEIHLLGRKQKEIGRWILLEVDKNTWERWRKSFGNK